MRGSLCGYVVRGTSEAPVARAYVEAVAGEVLEPRTTSTDGAGWFALDGLPPGRWLLHAWAPDHERGEASAQVFANAFGAVTIRLGDAPAVHATWREWMTRMQHGSIEGRVVRAATGEPVADASISIVRGPGSAPDIGPLTDAMGRFRLDALPPGPWTLRVLGPDGTVVEATVQVQAARAAPLEVALEADARGD